MSRVWFQQPISQYECCSHPITGSSAIPKLWNRDKGKIKYKNFATKTWWIFERYTHKLILKHRSAWANTLSVFWCMDCTVYETVMIKLLFYDWWIIQDATLSSFSTSIFPSLHNVCCFIMHNVTYHSQPILEWAVKWHGKMNRKCKQQQLYCVICLPGKVH